MGSIIAGSMTIAAIVEVTTWTIATGAFITKGLCSVKVVESVTDLGARGSASSLSLGGCYFACLISLSTFSIDSKSLGSETRSWGSSADC